MFKFLVFLTFIAVTLAGVLVNPAAVVYSTDAEYPSASGYEYQHTIQTPDYVNHASVSAPLNGFAAAPLVRAVYTHPLAYSPHAW